MRKRVVVVLEVEKEDGYDMTDEFIKDDLEREINCASNFYEVKEIKTEIMSYENEWNCPFSVNGKCKTCRILSIACNGENYRLCEQYKGVVIYDKEGRVYQPADERAFRRED